MIVDYFNKSEKNHALLNRVQSATSDSEKIELTRISKSMQIHATILPIRSVGVQGECFYVIIFIFFLTNIFDRRCALVQLRSRFIIRKIARLERSDVFGQTDTANFAQHQSGLLRVRRSGSPSNHRHYTHTNQSTCSGTDSASRSLSHSGTSSSPSVDRKQSFLHFTFSSSSTQSLLHFDCYKHISQMPVVLIPVHFDRDPASRIPSCARSVVLRPFLTSDFMTGVPIVPNTERLPLIVCRFFSTYIFFFCHLTIFIYLV